MENCFVRDFEQSKGKYLFYPQPFPPFMFSFTTEAKMIVMILDLFVGVRWAVSTVQFTGPDPDYPIKEYFILLEKIGQF